MKPVRKERSQRGAMSIMEAAFVFPIMFFVIVIMVMLGEAYYQNARVEYEVSHAAVYGAARCENPMLAYVQDNGNTVPTSPSATKVMPYRYIFTGRAQQIGTDVESELTQKINSMKPLAFRGMSPKNASISVTPKLNVLVSSLKASCEYDIELPIRMIFSDKRLKVHFSVGTVESIGDPSEFVRNVATVNDILERNEEAMDTFGKIKTAMDKIGRFIN